MNNFDDVWVWGQPLRQVGNKHMPKSYADNLIGSHWEVMRTVTRHNFWRTYQLWKQMLQRKEANIELMYEVQKYDLEAKAQGISNVQEFIAARIDRSQQSVSNYLQMLDMEAVQDELSTNFWYNDSNSVCISDGNQSTWQPSKKMVEKKIVSIPRDCAVGYDGCRGNTQNGKLAICFPCHSKLNADSGLMPEWVVAEQNRIRRDHYQQAVNACYEDYFGTVSIEEAESLMDAA